MQEHTGLQAPARDSQKSGAPPSSGTGFPITLLSDNSSAAKWWPSSLFSPLVLHFLALFHIGAEFYTDTHCMSRFKLECKTGRLRWLQRSLCVAEGAPGGVRLVTRQGWARLLSLRSL